MPVINEPYMTIHSIIIDNKIRTKACVHTAFVFVLLVIDCYIAVASLHKL